jgi:transcriptional regulator with PAS, ATPase and Fis domain
LPENLLEAELFGFEKGAFTGALHTKSGLMELAHLGTLFFDEVAELPLSLQPKLLRALQERKHRRLGGTQLVSFDVRVIAATNRDLGQLVLKGNFRQDLFYRLNVVRIHLPPLRMRENDVILLANHLLAEHRRKTPSGPQYFAQQVLQLFQEYSWPGNVRELQNVVEYCCALARTNTITMEDLPEDLQLYNPTALEIAPSAPPHSFKVAKARSLAQFETAYIADLLKRYDGNISQAAKAAGVDRKTFYALLQKHHLRRAAVATDPKGAGAL